MRARTGPIRRVEIDSVTHDVKDYRYELRTWWVRLACSEAEVWTDFDVADPEVERQPEEIVTCMGCISAEVR